MSGGDDQRAPAGQRRRRPKRNDFGAFLRKHSDAFESAQHLAQIIAFLGATFAGGFAIVQYLESRQDLREQEAMKLIELWETEPYQGAAETVRSAIASARASLVGLSTAPMSDLAFQEFTARVGALTLSSDTSLQTQVALDKLIYFGGRVGYCHQRNLCDETTLREYFGELLRSLSLYYRDYLAQKESESFSGFGSHLRGFVESTVGNLP